MNSVCKKKNGGFFYWIILKYLSSHWISIGIELLLGDVAAHCGPPPKLLTESPLLSVWASWEQKQQQREAERRRLFVGFVCIGCFGSVTRRLMYLPVYYLLLIITSRRVGHILILIEMDVLLLCFTDFLSNEIKFKGIHSISTFWLFIFIIISCWFGFNKNSLHLTCYS